MFVRMIIFLKKIRRWGKATLAPFIPSPVDSAYVMQRYKISMVVE